MKRVCCLLVLSYSLFVVSCSKKSHPAVSVPRTEEKKKAPDSEKMSAEVDAAPPPASPAPVVKNFSTPMVVVDAAGKIITPREQLPDDIGGKVKFAEIAKAYTPLQRNNLIYRFKIVPPRVLFVPEELTQHSAKGTYIVYKKKFWYWKKEDGLFHLDETYYQ